MQGTVKCPICGKPYKWYSHTVMDQSACPKCVAEAERSANGFRYGVGANEYNHR